MSHDDGSASAGGDPDWLVEKRAKIRARVRQQLAEARTRSSSPEAEAQRLEFLARYGFQHTEDRLVRVQNAIAEIEAHRRQPDWATIGNTVVRRYPEGMEQNTRDRLTADEVDARMGWTITDEGKARARRRLDAARDVDWDAVRAEVGLPARPAGA